MMTGQVEERIDVCDGHAFRAIADFLDLVPGSDFALMQDTEIESGPVMRHEKGGHARLIHANAHPIAGYTGLRHLKQRATDAIAVSDADFIVEKTFDSEVFSELSKGEVGTTKLSFPIVVRIHLVDENRPVLSAVTGEVCLLIAIDIELADRSPSLNRKLSKPMFGRLFRST